MARTKKQLSPKALENLRKIGNVIESTLGVAESWGEITQAVREALPAFYQIVASREEDDAAAMKAFQSRLYNLADEMVEQGVLSEKPRFRAEGISKEDLLDF